MTQETENQSDEFQFEAAHLLTREQVAEQLQVSIETLRAWARKGWGPLPLNIGPRTVRYSAWDIEAHLFCRKVVAKEQRADRVAHAQGGAA